MTCSVSNLQIKRNADQVLKKGPAVNAAYLSITKKSPACLETRCIMFACLKHDTYFLSIVFDSV